MKISLRKVDLDVLTSKDIVQKKDDEIVLVNTNRLYWMTSLSMRSIEDDNKMRKIVNKQLEVLDRAYSELQTFIPMNVKEVKVCFGNQLMDMPLNTFKKARQEDTRYLGAR